MMYMIMIVALPLAVIANVAAAAEGSSSRGQQVFRACIACHSLEPGKNMTGPTLSGIFGRKAGTLKSFSRYSPALESSDVTWDQNTLDAWIADPPRVIPGNTMTFPGIKQAQQRADLLAFLKEATQPGSARQAQQAPQRGGIRGGMMDTTVPNLRTVEPKDRVQAVTYCRDTYEVATADGKKRKFWERNLRFKTDSSEEGPMQGVPALVPAGMMGDRADVIFAGPDELGKFISKSC